MIGGLIERLLLRRLAGEQLPQVLLTLGCRLHHRRPLPDAVDRRSLAAGARPTHLRGAVQVAGLYFPLYRLVIVAVAVVVAVALWLMVDWTRLGAMIRAGVDDAPIARVVGIKVSQLFTLGVRAGRGAGRLSAA